MKQLFKERVAKATQIKCSQTDASFAGKLERIIREYDEDFGVAVSISDGVRFVLTPDRIVLDDMRRQKFAFSFNRQTKTIEIAEADEFYDEILSFLAVSKSIDKTVMDIIADIEKKLDIVSAILNDAGETEMRPAPVFEPARPDPEPAAVHEEVREPEPVPSLWDEEPKRESLSEELPEEVMHEPDPEPFREELRDEEHVRFEPESSFQEEPETAPEEIRQEAPAEPENTEDAMARNVVEKARNPFEAMRVLKSLGYSPDDFTKYGLSARDVAEYKELLAAQNQEL